MSAGKTSPSLETLRELALAVGLDVDVNLVPASDPAAAIAARVVTDPATPAADDLEGWDETSPEETASISAWVGRLERLAGNDPRRVLALAGRYSAPQHRRGARFFASKPGVTQQRLIEIASGALKGQVGALSGVVAAKVYLGHAPDPGPVVVWVSDTGAVAERLAVTLREADVYQPAGVLVAPTISAYFADMVKSPEWAHSVVSPVQAAIDLYGLGYDQLADEITEGW